MAEIRPFAALRPRPKDAAKICELPYDVMSSAEARQMARGNPLSFLHISKPEIDLPENTDIYAPEVYAKGRENFDHLIRDGALRRDRQPYFYFYRQIMGKHSQTGLVAGASCQEYFQGLIKKHEFTRPDKEDDRVKHIETLNSQTGPAFLVYRAVQEMDALAADYTTRTPDTDFVAADGIRHTSWTVQEATMAEAIRRIFAAIPFLYIADGHHRSAAAGRVCHSHNGEGASAHFLSVIFPHNQVQILPYNRALKDLNGATAEQMLKKLERVFDILPGNSPQPAGKHQVAMYLDGRWYTLRFRREVTDGRAGVDSLDVSLLQQQVLEPVFGIDDPRTSKRVQFVGGIRGPAELEKLVNSGDYACAFSMYPTGIEDLMAIADIGGIMPPKSTWFEPKLRDGMFCYML